MSRIDRAQNILTDRLNNTLDVSETGELFLTLKSEAGRRRKIGHIVDDIYYRVVKKDKHVLQTYNAFGFNHGAIELLNPKKLIIDDKRAGVNIRYILSREKYEIFKADIHFKTQGFEQQTYVPIHKFDHRALTPTDALPSNNILNSTFEEAQAAQAEIIEALKPSDPLQQGVIGFAQLLQLLYL